MSFIDLHCTSFQIMVYNDLLLEINYTKQKQKGTTMKNLHLSHSVLLCSLALVSLAFADGDPGPISIGYDSRNEVIFASVKGAFAGFGAYAGIRFIANNFKLDILQHPYATALSTVAGAAIFGFWKYQYIPENHFTFARSELFRISQNELFALLITTEPDKLVNTLKDRFFREKLPLYTAFRQLDRICSVVDQSKESLKEVLASTREDLYQESSQLLMIADMYLEILKDVFKHLKNDPNFIAECNAGTLEQMKEAQEIVAHAAETSALTQLAILSNHSQRDAIILAPAAAQITVNS
jgi:hypothetical protein